MDQEHDEIQRQTALFDIETFSDDSFTSLLDRAQTGCPLKVLIQSLHFCTNPNFHQKNPMGRQKSTF